MSVPYKREVYLHYTRYEEGKEDEMYGRLQQKLGKTKDEIKREIKSL